MHVHVVTNIRMTHVMQANASRMRRCGIGGTLAEILPREGIAMRRTVPFALTAAICFAGAAQAAPADTAASASTQTPFSTAITAQGFRAYDEAISSDSMDGRKPGTVGGQRATQTAGPAVRSSNRDSAKHLHQVLIAGHPYPQSISVAFRSMLGPIRISRQTLH